MRDGGITSVILYRVEAELPDFEALHRGKRPFGLNNRRDLSLPHGFQRRWAIIVDNPVDIR
jgi:hypothetical protein